MMPVTGAIGLLVAEPRGKLFAGSSSRLVIHLGSEEVGGPIPVGAAHPGKDRAARTMTLALNLIM